MHGVRVLWWIGLLELLARLGLTAFAGPTGQAAWLAAAVVAHGLFGVALGAALDPWLRERPALLCAALGLITGVLGLAVDGRPTVLAFGAVAAGLAWVRWRYPGEPSPRRTAFRAAFFAGLAVLLFALGGRPGDRTSWAAGEHAHGPNVVVVVLDTVRRDRLSTYGYPVETSPHLSTLAERGISFNGWANACWSLPGHATVLTGRYAGAHGAHYENGTMGADERTLQQAFGDLGYDTIAVTGNPWVHVGNGTGDGFGTFVAAWSADMVPDAFVITRAARRLLWGEGDKGGAWGAARFGRWLDARPEDARPFFALVNIFEAHAPYHRVDRRFLKRHLPASVPIGEARDVSEALLQHHLFGTGSPTEREAEVAGHLYDASVAGADHVLGLYLDGLRSRGFDERNTVFVVTSDHGEYFGEHGLWGHVHGLYDEVLQVPMVVAGPGIRALDQPLGPARLIDVAPTVLELAGAPREHWPEVHGRPLGSSRGFVPIVAEQYIPVLLAGEAGARAHTGQLDGFRVRRRSYQGPRYKLHAKQGTDGTEAQGLYQPSPSHRGWEDRDRGNELPEERRRLLRELEAWSEAHHIDWPDEVGAGAQVGGGWEAEALEALGYVQ